MRHRRTFAAIIFSAVVALAGCDDTPAGPILFDNAVNFNLSGSHITAESVRITGDIADAPFLGTYAAAEITGNGVIAILGVKQSSATVADVTVLIVANGIQQGTYTCEPDETVCGSEIAVELDVTSSAQQTGLRCQMDNSTVTISSIENDRVVGTFSGTGTCEDANGNVASTIVVTNGSFDVELGDLPVT